MTAGKCHSAESLLLVVDLQEKLGGAMPTKVLNRVLRNATLLLGAARVIDVPIVCTEQYPQGLGPTLAAVADTLPRDLSPVAKTSFSCAGDATCVAAIDGSGRRQVILLGMEAHVCILQTALDLLAAGREVFVVEDAICSRRLENYQNALDRMRQAGVVVVSAESVAFEWLADASNPAFSSVQALLR